MTFKINMKMNSRNIYLVFFNLIFIAYGCSVRYSFTGASIPPEVKTFSIQYFPIRAPLATANLNQRLVDKLREKIESQTNLIYSTGNADVDFEGEVKNYNTGIATVTAAERAEQNKLTIGIRVKFTNMADQELDFDKTFSRYILYPSTSNVDEAKEDEVLDEIIQDIFNEAFVNW